MKQQVLTSIGLTILILALFSKIWLPGLPLTHDSQAHLARMANAYTAIKDGHFPPRWAPNLNNGFGYPVFNFNYPLAYWLSVPFIAANFSIELTFKIITVLSLVAGCVGSFWIFKLYFSQPSSLIASLLYSLGIYSSQLVFVRGGIGELLYFAILPWLLYTLSILMKNKDGLMGALVALLFSCLLLSHNVLAFFGAPLVGIYIMLLYFLYNKNVHFLLPLVSGLGLTGFFWIPALIERRWTTLDSVTINQYFTEHFASISQLAVGAWGYGFSFPGPVDGLSLAVGMMPITLTVVAILATIKYRAWKQRVVLFTGASFLIYGFLMLPMSAPLWKSLPLLGFIQFPWRLNFFMTFIMAFWSAIAITSLKLHRGWLILLSLLIIIPAGQRNKPTTGFTHEDIYYLTTAETSSLADENMPIWFDKHKAYAFASDHFTTHPVYSNEAGVKIKVLSWKTAHHRYEIITDKTTRIWERTAYFPGWQTTANGVPINIHYDQPDSSGMLNYWLEPGTYMIETNFRETTWPRIIGNSISLISLGFLILHYVRKNKTL
jgi:hypothetical protein